MPHVSVVLPAVSALAGVGFASWWLADGPSGPWSVIGTLLFLGVLVYLWGRWLLPRSPVRGGYMIEVVGLLTVAFGLVVTTPATYWILNAASGPGASARAAATYTAVSTALSAGCAAVICAVDPLSVRLPEILDRAFPRIPGTSPESDDARWAKSVPKYSPHSSQGNAVDGWSWAARRERLRQIERGI
jgi:hypothetical protein